MFVNRIFNTVFLVEMIPKRNHIEILKEIDQMISEGGFAEEHLQLENEIRASSTGGELCLMACAKLYFCGY